MKRIEGLEKHEKLRKLLEKINRRIAEREPEDAGVNMRKAIEYITLQYAKEESRYLMEDKLFDRIEGLRAQDIISREAADLFHAVRMTGNAGGAHFSEEAMSLEKIENLFGRLVEYIPSFLEDFPEPSRSKAEDNPLDIDYTKITPLKIVYDDYIEELGLDWMPSADEYDLELEEREILEQFWWLNDPDSNYMYISPEDGCRYINRFQWVVDCAAEVEKLLKKGDYGEEVKIPALIQEYFGYSFVRISAVEEKEVIQGPHGMTAVRSKGFKRGAEYGEMDISKCLDFQEAFTDALYVPDGVKVINDENEFYRSHRKGHSVRSIYLPKSLSADQDFGWLTKYGSDIELILEEGGEFLLQDGMLYTKDKKKLIFASCGVPPIGVLDSGVEVIGEEQPAAPQAASQDQPTDPRENAQAKPAMKPQEDIRPLALRKYPEPQFHVARSEENWIKEGPDDFDDYIEWLIYYCSDESKLGIQAIWLERGSRKFDIKKLELIGAICEKKGIPVPEGTMLSKENEASIVDRYEIPDLNIKRSIEDRAKEGPEIFSEYVEWIRYHCNDDSAVGILPFWISVGAEKFGVTERGFVKAMRGGRHLIPQIQYRYPSPEEIKDGNVKNWYKKGPFDLKEYIEWVSYHRPDHSIIGIAPLWICIGARKFGITENEFITSICEIKGIPVPRVLPVLKPQSLEKYPVADFSGPGSEQFWIDKIPDDYDDAIDWLIYYCSDRSEIGVANIWVERGRKKFRKSLSEFKAAIRNRKTGSSPQEDDPLPPQKKPEKESVFGFLGKLFK